MPFLTIARVGLIIATSGSVSLPVLGQTVCGDRGRFVEQLNQRFSEVPVALGVIDNGSVLELFTSETGSWTILITRSDGKSCIIASGENWERMDVERGDAS